MTRWFRLLLYWYFAPTSNTWREVHIASGAVMPNKANALAMDWRAAATRRSRPLRTGSSACKHRALIVKIAKGFGQLIRQAGDVQRAIFRRRPLHFFWQPRNQIDQLDFSLGHVVIESRCSAGICTTGLAQDAVGAHRGILNIRRGLTVEIQGSFPIKGDDLGIFARQHGVFNRPNADRAGQSPSSARRSAPGSSPQPLPARGGSPRGSGLRAAPPCPRVKP